MTPSKSSKRDPEPGPAGARAKRRYEKPRLTDYGPVSKLTQSGSVTNKDTGSMFRPCL